MKLASYAKVATNVASIAALLKASHVKDPRGEFVLLCPEAELCVKLLRVVKNGVKTALKAINRRFLPGVDTSSLVEAALAGQLIGDGACTVADLALATKAKVWLGVAAAAASNTAAASKDNQLAVLLKALPLISFSLMQMQPEDDDGCSHDDGCDGERGPRRGGALGRRDGCRAARSADARLWRGLRLLSEVGDCCRANPGRGVG